MNVATALNSGMTHEQCKTKWKRLVAQKEVIIDKARCTTSWNTRDPDNDYPDDGDDDDDVEKAYSNQRKKASGERIRWSLEMV